MIHRDGHKDNYTIISNDLLRNTSLSCEARCLLLFLLSCADDFEFSVRGLASLMNTSIGSISHRVQELQRAGYIKMSQVREKGQFASYTWDVFESPCSEIPNTVSPNTATPNTVLTEHGLTEYGETEHIRINNTKELSNERMIKKISKKNPRFIKPTVEEIREYCIERGNQVDPQRFYDYYESNGWKVGKNPMKDWKAAVRTWERSTYSAPKAKTEPISENPFTRLRREEGYES